MSKMSIYEAIKCLEDLAEIRMSLFTYNDFEGEEKANKQVKILLEKYSILDLLIIKFTTKSLLVKYDIEDELKRRIDDATKNND